MLEGKALTPNKSIQQYVTMATAEPIIMFLCMVWVNMFAYDHNLPQNQMGDQKLFRISYHLNNTIHLVSTVPPNPK